MWPLTVDRGGGESERFAPLRDVLFVTVLISQVKGFFTYLEKQAPLMGCLREGRLILGEPYRILRYVYLKKE